MVSLLRSGRKTAGAAMAAAAFVLPTTLIAAPPAHAQNVIQKHPTATGVAAGVATHAALKRSAAYKKAHHQKLSWAERHPTLTGIGAGVATRAVIKKTTHHTVH